MAELTGIEQEVVRKAWPSSYGFFFANRIKEVTERLFALSTIIGEPIQYRLSRSGYYFSRSQAQVKELGVVKIPAWQSYSEFLDRRLYQTYSQISGMTGRIDRVLKFLEAQSSALQNRHALLWQILAGLAALIVLPSYFGDIAQKAACNWWIGYWVGFGGLLFSGVAFWGITARQERAKERRRSDMLDRYSKQ
jgi:enamine deaminase RidA (YjgF/YER057c/UK114 family)